MLITAGELNPKMFVNIERIVPGEIFKNFMFNYSRLANTTHQSFRKINPINWKKSANLW